VAANRSRAVLAGDTRCVAIRTLHSVAQGVGWHASVPRVRGGPQRHSRMAPSLPWPSIWTPLRRPRPEQEAPSRQRRHWTAMRPNAHFEFTETTGAQPLTLFSKAPDRGRHRPHAIIHPRIRERCSCCSSISRSRRRCRSPS